MSTQAAVSDTVQAHEHGVSATDPVWTFRGYQMRPAEFNTAIVHLHRAEVQRANTWRTRLDQTTNWAVVTTGAAISFSLSDPNHFHGVIVLNTLLVTLFLWIESRRYRYYELWSHRIRMIETDFFAAMFSPPFAPSPTWAESLTESLLRPDFPVSMWEAFGRRFRRNYMWIFLILGAAWMLKMFLHPTPADSLEQLIARANLGSLSGEIVVMVGVAFNGAIFLIGFLTVGLAQASGEVLPKWGEDVPVLNALWRSMEIRDPEAATAHGTSRPARPTLRRRKQLLALIISTRSQAIADRVLHETQRGVTILHGQGSYTKQERDVLMIAVTTTEMQHLKALVYAEDPSAFMIVTPALEIIGRGFQPMVV
jgi:uncharacterized membrane protein